jgi:hypothetical protein
MAARFGNVRPVGASAEARRAGIALDHRRHRTGAVGGGATYSGLIFESLITFAHFAVSSL